jgi:glycosyltransferase involved in cell wall biosynthesis
LLYLIGQFPAINHGYLLAEVRHLRTLGIDVRVASVSPADRPAGEFSKVEREEAARTFYIKSLPPAKIPLLLLTEFFSHPIRFLSGLFFSLKLAGIKPASIAYHLAYFSEAVVVGRYMRQSGVTHVHASFSATVALIVTRVFPVTMSFGVYGFGELHNPSQTHLAERIQGAVFVRSISRFGRGQLMLSCGRDEWSKLVYVPLGIDAAEFPPLPARNPSSPPHILCVGRLAPEKGQSLLLEAMAALNASAFPLHLTLVGDGPDRNFLERRAAELGIEAHVEFAGWIDEARLMDFYAKTDVFVLPSLAEGIPMVLIEAMAMQIPCVAPCIAGIPELIESGVHGMLYSVADVNELSSQLRTLLESPDLTEQIGRQARLRVLRDYDMARNTERFAAVLRDRL